MPHLTLSAISQPNSDDRALDRACRRAASFKLSCLDGICASPALLKNNTSQLTAKPACFPMPALGFFTALLRPEICGRARIRSQAGFGYGSGWTGRHQPGNLVEIEKVEQVWLSGVARGERSSSQEAGLHEFDDRGVIHGDVR